MHQQFENEIYNIEDVKNVIIIKTNKGFKQKCNDNTIYISHFYGNPIDLMSSLPCKFGYLCFTILITILFYHWPPSPGPNLYFPALLSICVYRHWLIRTGNNKSQRLPILLLFLFWLSNSFVTVIVDRNETKDSSNKKQIHR